MYGSISLKIVLKQSHWRSPSYFSSDRFRNIGAEEIFNARTHDKRKFSDRRNVTCSTGQIEDQSIEGLNRNGSMPRKTHLFFLRVGKKIPNPRIARMKEN